MLASSDAVASAASLLRSLHTTHRLPPPPPFELGADAHGAVCDAEAAALVTGDVGSLEQIRKKEAEERAKAEAKAAADAAARAARAAMENAEAIKAATAVYKEKSDIFKSAEAEARKRRLDRERHEDPVAERGATWYLRRPAVNEYLLPLPLPIQIEPSRPLQLRPWVVVQGRGGIDLSGEAACEEVAEKLARNR